MNLTPLQYDPPDVLMVLRLKTWRQRHDTNRKVGFRTAKTKDVVRVAERVQDGESARDDLPGCEARYESQVLAL